MPALSPISSPGLCTLDQNGDTGVTTNIEVVVVYYYEIEYDPSIFDPTQRGMIFLVETTTAKGLLKGLFESECDTAQERQIQVYAIRQRWLQNKFGVVGFSSQPSDTVVPGESVVLQFVKVMMRHLSYHLMYVINRDLLRRSEQFNKCLCPN